MSAIALIGICAAVVWFVFLADRKPNQNLPKTEEVANNQSNVPLGQPGGGPNPPSPFAMKAEPQKPAQPLTAVPADLADMIFLLPNEITRPELTAPDFFEMEMARQSLWMAAREEFGLRVRDASLGETMPKALPTDRQFRIRYTPLIPKPWEILVGTAPREHTFWSGSLVGYSYTSYSHLFLSSHEELTRGFFVKCLAGVGFSAKPNAKSNAPVPAEVEEALAEMRETSQFAAIRRLHDEIRAKGESDDLIAALARGYANLGILTEYHWNDAPLAFKARGLLYAQRLVTRSPQSPHAIYIRAYAEALAGLHAAAIEDVTAAKKLAANAKSAMPPWVDAIDAYVHFDFARLTAAKNKDNTPLVRFLLFLAFEAPETSASTIGAGRQFLTTEPECYRVHDSMCRVGGVSHLHEATLTGMRIFTQNLGRRLKEMPNLPAAVRDSLEGDEIEPGVYSALRNEGGPSDRGEPSWAALGDLLQEVRFTQVWHRLIFMAEYWSVDTHEATLQFKPLLAGHRFESLIGSFSLDIRSKPNEVRNILLSAPVREVDMKAKGYQFRLRRVDPTAATNWFRRALHGHGLLFPEVARQARSFPDGYATELTPLTKWLLRVSPYSPTTQAYYARYGAPEVVAKLSEIEKQYADYAVVQAGLGHRYIAENRTNDAIRCWKRWVQLSPSGEAFRKLAGLYRTTGDETRWRETLEASLKEEDTGLFHAEVQVEIARYYMQKKDFKRAEPYAMAAAKSGAGWALVCAAECQEGLEQWDKANELYEVATNRYDQTAYTWYLACCASGKMDRNAAEGAVRGYITRFGTGTTGGELFLSGRFYLLAGDRKAARQLFDRANQLGPSDLSLIFASLLADAEGDSKGCIAALDQFANLPLAKNLARPLGVALREWISANKVPDAAAVDAALSKLRPEFRADGEFCIGWYLHNHKLEDRAVALWKRCREATTGTRWVKTHAQACLDSASRKKD